MGVTGIGVMTRLSAGALALALLAFAASPAAAAPGPDDPAPVARPDALQQPLDDGCQRNPAGLLAFVSPEWVYASHDDPANTDPAKARLVEGTVTRSDTATGDLPQAHEYYDFNTDVVPDAGYEYLLGGSPADQNGNFADNPSILHVEWESGTMPPWTWATADDRVKLWGSWVWDCGHWGQGFTADPDDPTGTIIDDTDYFLPGANQTGGLRGEQTEFHPMQAVAVTRANPSVPQVGETETNVFISSKGTPALANSRCSLEHPAPTPLSYGPDWTLCINDPSKQRQPANDRDYTFFVPAPPRPADGVPLRVRVVDHDPGGIGPVEQITPRADGIEVTVPFKGFGSPTDELGYGKSFFVGWDGPVQRHPAHVEVELKQITVHNSLDDPALGTSLGVPPGEWELYSDINGSWQWLDEFAPELEAVNTGNTIDINHTSDIYVPDGEKLRIAVYGRECDLPRIQPCPITSELAEDNDSPGPAADVYDSVSEALGTHTLKPSGTGPNWEMTYEVRLVTPAGTGGPAGEGCFDTIAPQSRTLAGRSGGRLNLHGTATDQGCPGGTAAIRGVEVSVIRHVPRNLCRHLYPNGKLSRKRSCFDRKFIPASGRESWSLPAARGLDPGHYLARARARDASGNVELNIGDASLARFRVR